jgi:polar amino acid transport system ATP-binding protein/sulfate transport system ATP-binding protein
VLHISSVGASCYAVPHGKQRLRCFIIQQILCSDHFLLMDEPFSGLDLLMLEKTSELIQKVANMDELNPIIVVTHDITAVSDHLWLMGRMTRRAIPCQVRISLRATT